MAMVIRMTMIVTTTISSTKVNPRRRWAALPLSIWSPIRRLIGRLAVDVKYILTTPARGLGVVLIAAHSPIGVACKRVARNAAEQIDFLIFRAVEFDPVHQNFQRLRIAVGTELDG